MFKKKTLIFILLICTAASSLYSAENPFPLPPSALSSSYSGGSFSSMVNPVFTDMDSTTGIAYRYMSYNNADKGNHFASLNLFGFDFIYSRYNTIPDIAGDSLLDSGVNLYSINRGFFFGNAFGFGGGYSFSSGSDDYFSSYSGWSTGLLFRPVKFISLGAAFRDINGEIGGEEIDPSMDYSLSLRPWKEHLTLTAGCITQKNRDTGYYYSAEIKGYREISLSLKYGTDKTITAGLTLPIYMRSGNGMEMIIDAYGSGKSETADFRSAGIAFSSKREKKTICFAPADNFITLKISGNYKSERDESGVFSKREPVFQDLLRGLSQIGDDPAITGLIIEIESSGFGMAQTQEIRDLLNRLRAGGKKVYTILNYPGNKEYYLATASDKLFFTPNSTFKITGLSAKAYFLKGLLDKGGVKFESISKGRYKSFNETYTRTDMSEHARENLKEILTDLNEQFISGITSERKITREAVEELFKKGLYSPSEAKEKGFIDEVMYANEAADSIQKKGKTISFAEYIREERSTGSWGPLPAVAVINVTGSIVSGKGGGSAMSNSTGDYEYKLSIDKAFSDRSVKAVVIRVDSGGGSASASDFMWNALHAAKNKNPKPVVFSFGNTAASGGYYIACTGDPVFAGRGTITGSIGVVAGKVSAEELYSKLGINTETIKMSEFADIFSESRSLTENDKVLLQKEIDFIYDRFTGKVMEGRGISESEITQIAEGKIHTGSAAKSNRLINETGGLIAALEYARDKAGLDSEYRIVNLPENRSIFRGILGNDGTSVIFRHMEFLVQNLEKYKMLEEQALYIQPYSIEIE
jgi:protease-4